MTHRAPQAFAAHAAAYDTERRRLVPPFDAFYGAALEALGRLGGPPRRILDLGAGTGLLSAMVADAYPDAELVLLDGAAPMLARAEAVLGDRATYHVGDLRDALPGGPYCAVVSALAIHHLEDDDKRALFARAFAALKPGGAFVDAEQVRAPTPWLEEGEEAWHRDAAAARGATPEQWAGAVERMRHDRLATLEDQLGWLRDAGFADVDCPFKQRRFAVLFARRARD
jgi:tRNA (cmo5U34)-methyltransferase